MSGSLLYKKKKLKILKIIKWCILAVGIVLIALVIYDRETQWDGSYCSRAVRCSSCINGEQECSYIIETDNGAFIESEDTILCDCITP